MTGATYRDFGLMKSLEQKLMVLREGSSIFARQSSESVFVMRVAFER